jgi:hypothetical protein
MPLEGVLEPPAGFPAAEALYPTARCVPLYSGGATRGGLEFSVDR